MKVETRVYYIDLNGNKRLDKWESRPKHDISEEKAHVAMHMLEDWGYDRTETKKKICYEMRYCYTESEKIIFYKEE